MSDKERYPKGRGIIRSEFTVVRFRGQWTPNESQAESERLA
jgi:hypothetical protein